MKKIRVLHIIPTLAPGGAERMAVHILRGINAQRFDFRTELRLGGLPALGD